MDQSTTYSSDRTGSPGGRVNVVNFCDDAGMVHITNNSGDRTGRPGGRVNVVKPGDGTSTTHTNNSGDGTVIIGDPVVGTVNPQDLHTASSLMSQPPYGTQNDH